MAPELIHSEAAMLLTVEQAARLCGWSPSKMWDLVMSGDVPSLKVIGSRRIKREALVGWIEEKAECEKALA